MSTEPSWSEQRRAAAAEHEARLHRRQRQESDRAQALLDRFAAAARRAGLEPEPLRVQGYGGHGSARTPRQGWYLRRDHTVAVGTEGEFYVLTANLSLADRLRGTDVRPSPPPLVIGAGGKDGDSLELGEALNRVLPGWDSAAPAEG